MAVTLQQLYELVKDKEEMLLVAGAEGITNIVRWVHMVESIDISSFLEGEEVVFTTGIALKDEQELLALVENNHKLKAAGMVINVGPYITEIPQEVIDYGNQHQFPIFRVPWRVHMSNIMREFSTQIHMDNLRKMEIEEALKNACFLPEQEALYVPALQKNGFRREWNYIVAMIEVEAATGGKLPENLKQRLRFMENEAFRIWKKDVMLLEEGHTLLVVFGNQTEEDAKKRVEAFWDGLQRIAGTHMKLYAGIGGIAANAAQIHKSYQQAEQVLHIQKGRGLQQVMSYEQMGLYKIIFALTQQDILEEFYQETLGELERYDLVKGSDYLAFLKVYLQLNGSVLQVANALHLHRNSVTYKIRKIEEILEISLDDYMTQTKLMVALMILEMK